MPLPNHRADNIYKRYHTAEPVSILSVKKNYKGVTGCCYLDTFISFFINLVNIIGSQL